MFQETNCNKAPKVFGRVVEIIGDQGYALEEDGTQVRIAVPGERVKQRGLPAVGTNIRAGVFVYCSKPLEVSVAGLI